MSRARKAWLISMIVLAFLDCISTYIALNTGMGEEMNPFAARLSEQIGPLLTFLIIGPLAKLLWIYVMVFFLRKIDAKYPAVVIFLMTFSLLFSILIIVNNTYQLWLAYSYLRS